MSEKYADDADWATAAEQSSEDDEAQEGNILAEEERSSAPAEHLAIHVVDDEADADDADVLLFAAEQLAHRLRLGLDGAGRGLLDKEVTVLAVLKGEENEIHRFF